MSSRVLRLDDALQTALKNPPTIMNARAQTAAAQGRVTQAKQLYYPQASYQRVRSASKGGVIATTSGTSGTGTSGSTAGTGTSGTSSGTGASTPTAFGSTDASGSNVWRQPLAARLGLRRDRATPSCLLRFRPIMMTTLAAMLGAVPLAIGGGVGSELRQPLGIAIVGRLFFSQALTLFTTSVVYLALDRFTKRNRQHAHERATVAPT